VLLVCALKKVTYNLKVILYVPQPRYEGKMI